MSNKKVGTVFIFLLILGLCLPPSPAQDINPIMIYNIELVTVDETSAIVTWSTNLPSDTKVQWGPTEELGEERIVEESVPNHLGKIDGLAQGSKCYYRIGSGNAWSNILNFTTLVAPGGGFKLKFAVVADTHYDVNGQNTPNGMMYEDSVRLLDSLVDELNNDPGIEFAIIDGDITNGAEADYEGYATAIERLNVTWYPVMGNHDKTFPDWATWLNNSWGRTETYYDIKYAGYHMVILDSAVQGQISGDIDDEQLDWLENVLDANSDKPTMLFMHHMPDRSDNNGIDEDARIRLASILETRPYVLSIHSGHLHKNLVLNGSGNSTYVTIAAVVSYPIGYSKVKLYGDGYTQAFYKIESELATSEESRLRMNTGPGGPNTDDGYLGDLDDRSIVVKVPKIPSPPPTPPNQPPIISSISINPTQIYTSETATVTVVAEDPDGDEIFYTYDTDGGTIDGSGAKVTYNAPPLSGTYTIYVKANDGIHTSKEKSVEIEVWSIDIPINHVPVIKNTQASFSEVHPGDSVELDVDADDEDGDSLTYHYEPSGGSISGKGSEVVWHAPDYTGVFTITVWVSDGELNSDKEKITISVIDAPKEDGDWEIPGFEIMVVILALLILICGFKTVGYVQKKN